MGYLSQEPSVFRKLTVAENVMAVLEMLDIDKSERRRRLAGLLERFNQSRINWFHSRDELRIEYESLQQETAALKEQNTLLEQKIQAITDVEATISTRKEE